MQKVQTFPSLPHLPLNSLLSLLDVPWLAAAFVVITPLPMGAVKENLYS